MKKIPIRGVAFRVLLSCLIAGAPPAFAHDFWIQPDQYQLVSPAPISMTLQVGHGAGRQRSPIPLRRITRFDAISPAGEKTNSRNTLHLGDKAGDGDIRLLVPGIHTLALETDTLAQSRLPAKKFNAYLEDEGVTPAREDRKRLNRMNAEGSERYGRVAKALVCVGRCDAGTKEDFSKPLGLPLEITLEQNPFAEPKPAWLRVRVTYEGRPLAGALVKFTNLEHDEAPHSMAKTDKEGRANFTMPQSGAWLLNVIWTRALPASSDTTYETIFSSLSFGFATANTAD